MHYTVMPFKASYIYIYNTFDLIYNSSKKIFCLVKDIQVVKNFLSDH